MSSIDARVTIGPRRPVRDPAAGRRKNCQLFCGLPPFDAAQPFDEVVALASVSGSHRCSGVKAARTRWQPSRPCVGRCPVPGPQYSACRDRCRAPGRRPTIPVERPPPANGTMPQSVARTPPARRRRQVAPNVPRPLARRPATGEDERLDGSMTAPDVLLVRAGCPPWGSPTRQEPRSSRDPPQILGAHLVNETLAGDEPAHLGHCEVAHA